MYTCPTCKIDKVRTDYFNDATSCRGFDYICKACKSNKYSTKRKEYREKNKEALRAKQKEYAKKNPDIFMNNSLKFHYGISLNDYNVMLSSQGGVCAICYQTKFNKRNKRLFVDHNHTTGKVRGLLCINCNSVVGHCKEDISILDKTKIYLDKHT